MDRLSTSQTFEAVLGLERWGLTRTAAFRQLATDLGVSVSAVQSRFYDEAARRGGIPRGGRGAPARGGAAAAATGLHLLFQQYLTRLNSKRVTAEHLAKTERSLGRFHRHLLDEGVDPLAVPYHVAQGYFDGLVRELSLQTVKKTHLTAISAAYRFAQDLGMAVANPTKLVVLPEQADAAPATYTNDELRRMLAAVETEQEELCLHTFIWTGMRRFEALGVRLDRIDWEANCVPVLGKGRPRKLRLVPMHPTFRTSAASGRRTCPGRSGVSDRVKPETGDGSRPANRDLDGGRRAGRRGVEGHESVSKDGLQCSLRGGSSRELHRGHPRTRAAHRKRASLPARARPETAGDDPAALPLGSA